MRLTGVESRRTEQFAFAPGGFGPITVPNEPTD
jgi:hypothetical protein